MKQQPIKLLEIAPSTDGTRRFQTQLILGSNIASHVIQADGLLRSWSYGSEGVDFYPTDEEYIIVSDARDMGVQQL